MVDNRHIKYYLLITANPLSDSAASIAIFKTIKSLDLLSGKIKIYMPGFHTDEDGIGVNAMMSQMSDNNKAEEDYHGHQPLFHTYCESAGNMYFNDVDFAKFMIDLEESCPNFSYYGDTELLVLPAHNGEVLFDRIKNYNLESFFNCEQKTKFTLDSFLLRIIKLIKSDPDNHSISLLDKIDNLYLSRFATHSEDRTVNIKVDNYILEHMKWELTDEIFFISYSTKDELSAYSLKELLEKNGKQVWIAPDGIPAGIDYACAIPAALRLTSRFVVILSHNSAQSSWVRKEIGKAISNNKKVDGIFIDGFTYNDMKQYDHLDFLFENVQLRYSITNLIDNPTVLSDFINN